MDTTTGEAIKLVEVVGGISTRGVAFGPNGGFFASEGTTQTLYTLNMLTGVKTTVGGVDNFGNIGFTIDNLHFDTGSSPARFLALNTGSDSLPDRIISIDPGTGIGSVVTSLMTDTGQPVSLNGCALTKNPEDGRWFTIARLFIVTNLFEIDVKSGVVSIIGPLNQFGIVASAGICGLAFEDVFVEPPEPPSE